MILGLSVVVLLAERLTDFGVGGHEDPGLRPVDPRLPGALGGRDTPLAVELGGRLADVPDVALRVLCIPVGRALGEAPLYVEQVPNDGGTHARDQLRPARNREHLPRRLSVLGAAVDVDRSGLEREPRIGDLPDETGWAGMPCRRGGRQHEQENPEGD